MHRYYRYNLISESTGKYISHFHYESAYCPGGIETRPICKYHLGGYNV